MLINETEKYNEIWDKVYDLLKFAPSYEYRGHSFNVHLPFQISVDYSVYAIDDMTDEQIDLINDTMRQIFIDITKAGQKIYALDWHHSAFLYDPRNISEQKSLIIHDEGYNNGEYLADFPSFYPDGDYYFFIAEDFSFGYLGHTWRQEIWVFGADLMSEIEAVHKSFGWRKLR